MPYIKSNGIQIEFGIGISEIIESLKLFSTKQNPYLIYDVDHIRTIYQDEKINWLMINSPRLSGTPIFSPYEMVFDYRKEKIQGIWGDVKLIEKDFVFPSSLSKHKTEMVNQFKKKGKLYKGDGECVRIIDFSWSSIGIPQFTVQKASYYDQVGTNLTVDYPFSQPIRNYESALNVRDWDMEQAKTKDRPPSFEKSKLANTIGVVVGVTAKDTLNRTVSLRCKRNKKTVAVYEGQWHVPVSFALAWPTLVNKIKIKQLSELIIQDWAQEFRSRVRLREV